MNKKPLISVIVPCYNVEKYVGQCLESILSQSYENIEVLVINDGSTDNTEQMIKPFLNDDRIKYFFQNNKGVSEARNTGLRVMKGEYICFVDSDDYVHQDYIKILYETLIKYDTDMSICNFLYNFNGIFKYYDNNKKLNIINNKKECMELINIDIRYIVPWGKLYKSILFENLSYKLNKVHEDEFMAHHIFWKIREVVYINKVLYYYRKEVDDSITKLPSEERLINIIEAFDDRIDFYKKNKILSIKLVFYLKWNVIIYKNIKSEYIKKYILFHPIEFFTKFKFPIKKKIKLYFKILFKMKI